MQPTLSNPSHAPSKIKRYWMSLLNRTRGQLIGESWDLLEPALPGIGGLMLGIVQEKPTWLFNSDSPWLFRLFIIGCIFCVLGLIFNIISAYKKKKLEQQNIILNKKISELNNKYETQSLALNAKYKELLDDILISLFNNCNFSEKERISVYRYDTSSGRVAFILIGRYAKNPDYGTPNPNNKIYDNTKNGVIGKSWKDGNFFIDNLPDPETELESYKKALESAGIMVSEDHFTAIRMKCRSYLAKNIENQKQTNVAVIVFESLEPNGIIKDKINSTFETNLDSVKKLVEYANDLNADLQTAINQNY